ncbi:MAG TPA: neutral/alkaline non-lysosomal ceramidase N-terminal domain-containing protein [Candidatus Hydrogenedentes bacterium]|nr:neutral/alkaline non-lysosomal ceramidase N-terminal domain-containing protein [Candidatus Hydrogenedentota bacterium]HOV61697.1 neutral/alkaline non-lysosomal ceramidase N-terminal domain-containing protein [Candidatus Hydrogenedentota bacterium]
MKIFKRIVLGFLIVVVTIVFLFWLFIGPWPVYKDNRFAEKNYYKKALQAIDEGAARNDFTANPSRLQAGWAEVTITPKIGTPMAGYGGRPDGKRSRGVRDELHCRVLAVSDGKDMAAIVTTDMLLTPPTVAELVWQKAPQRTPLDRHNIYFTASHTHCGPGGTLPGLAGKFSSGAYDPTVPEFLAERVTEALEAACNSLAPAKFAHGMVDAEQYIRNRARKGPVDNALQYLLFEKENGDRAVLVRFSAHPTNFDQDMMDFTAEFPGELCRALAPQVKGMAMYAGGGLGSMSPRAPEAPTPSDRIVLLGQALAKLVVDDLAAHPPQFVDRADIAALSVDVGTSSFQMRPISPKWRLSPLAYLVAGVKKEGAVQALRLGNVIFVGLPFDVSGELCREWREAMAPRGIDLWVTSFAPGYLGYLSPDKYYNETEEKGTLGYEIGLMNWFGPSTGSYMEALTRRVVDDLCPASSPLTVAAPQATTTPQREAA